MKSLFFTLSLIFLTALCSYAQTGHEVHGVVIDSTKLSVPGSQLKLISDQGDSSLTAADPNGKFSFPGVKGSHITITVTSIGYQSLRKHYVLDNSSSIDLGSIVLVQEANQLKTVNINGVSPITIKEDTVEYKVSSYPVRQNAPIEDVIKKLPGVDVDVNGNITAQGKQVTKVRVNGKDFFGGDVQTATKNLPADMIESIQMIDDYGDQANLTGVKTGEPDKIMNITIRKDKNYGYSGQATGGDGADLLPPGQGSDQNRYVGMLNSFDFNGDRQIALLGSLNNTNVNPFNYNATGGTVGGSGFSGGGGGRGNALRAQASTGLATTANGITDARSIGTNYRDQWGKYISVYGSYSFTDNSTLTTSNTFQQNNFSTPSTSSQIGTEQDNPINHRFTFNLEYKPDTINYLKVTPTFSYASTYTTDNENVKSSRFDDTTMSQKTNLAYNSRSVSASSTPNFGLTALYNHRFNGHGRNFSANFTFSTSQTNSYDDPTYTYTLGTPTAPTNQLISTDSRTTSYGATFSYLEPLSKVSYLELNYAYNHSYTASDKETDTLSFTAPTAQDYNNDPLLSNNYTFTFVTNRVGLNYRVVEKKYNYTLGIAAQPTTLDGQSLTTGDETHVTTFDFVPTAHFVYNFQRSQTLSFNYSGASAQPSFAQLQPVIDYSNALYPVQGNADLKPSFNNNFTIRYNKFSFATGNVFFIGAFFTQTSDYAATNTITYPGHFTDAVLLANPGLSKLQNTNLSTYLNTNGYYTGSAFFAFSKPWDERKFTVSLNGNVSYTNNISYSSSINEDDLESDVERDIAKSLVFTPTVKFRTDITDVIDAQASASYSISSTVNSIKDSLFDQNTNIRALTLELTGKNYVWKDWTFSYDYTKTVNYGYDIKVSNPNVLNTYIERRFLKNNAGTIRIAAYDLFNQNTGFSTTTNGSIVTQSNVNRLGRYYLLTFTLRLQKFAGKAPTPDQPGQHNFRRNGGPGGGGPGGGGPGGPGGGGPTLD